MDRLEHSQFNEQKTLKYKRVNEIGIDQELDSLDELRCNEIEINVF